MSEDSIFVRKTAEQISREGDKKNFKRKIYLIEAVL